jgi:type I restriction enzyme S subunit
MRDGWVNTPLGEIVELGKGGSWGQDDPDDGLIQAICLRGTDLAELIDGRVPAAPVRWIKESELKKSSCSKDMVLIETSGSKCGRSIVLTQDILDKFDLPVIYSNFCRTLSIDIKRVTREFVETWFSHHYANGLIPSYRATSAMPNLDVKALLRVEIMKVPPLTEQKRIVDLISSVDSYIEALQQQLESAKKSRNALLHELLTAGGDDWVETTLGEVALLNPSEPALSVTAHFAPMDAVHVGKRWLQYTEERRDRNGARARAGDVLFARITPCLENGKVAQVQSDLERCGGSTEFIVVRGTERCTSDFLYFWCTLKVNRDKAAELMTGTTGRQRLSWQGLGSLSLWLPSIAEQERIVHNISEFDSFIESTESAITESQNLRSGLLSDLLRGEHEIPASYDKVIGAA